LELTASATNEIFSAGKYENLRRPIMDYMQNSKQEEHLDGEHTRISMEKHMRAFLYSPTKKVKLFLSTVIICGNLSSGKIS
jgi:hypothetical protein